MCSGFTWRLLALCSCSLSFSTCEFYGQVFSTWASADIVPSSSPIPEITDADMAFQATETHANADVKPFRKQYRLFHAAFAQFCYTGAQVGIAGFVSFSRTRQSAEHDDEQAV